MLDFRYLVATSYAQELKESKFRGFLPSSLEQFVEFEDARPNLKEGGLFLTAKYKDISEDDLLLKLKDFLAEKKLRSSYNLQPVIPYIVKGTPFMEDMIGRIPSTSFVN
jgi:hypothetical protein